MLRSTHKPAEPPPLPDGWTVHKAPTGHTYYYNSAIGKSTYTRPTVSSAPPQDQPLDEVSHPELTTKDIPRLGFADSDASTLRQLGINPSEPGNTTLPLIQHESRRQEPKDRPRSKQAIPGAHPWLLVQTKLRRRFVYNPEKNESFWKFPPDVLKCVVDLDRRERERKERRRRGEPSDPESESEVKETVNPIAHKPPEDSDEYEEIEVTDEEDEGNVAKRQRVEVGGEPQGPLEFNEDDMAYQLEAMGDQESENAYYGDQDVWDDAEEELDPSDARALFHDLLDDFHVNPYTPWDAMIEDGKIIEDDRYLCLPNMRSRKEVWEEWSRNRIQKLKEERALQEKRDPRIPYLAFLREKATPKLYWPEFKRKFRKEAEMRDSKMADKDREKWYREHINRLKLPETTLKSDLTSLLKSLPLSVLNRSTSISALPPEALTDIRFISLRSSVRDPLIETYIDMLPPAPEPTSTSAEEEAELANRKVERERREKALKEREQRVDAARRHREFQLRASKGALEAGEEEIRRAMQVGKEGLLGHLTQDAEQANDSDRG